VRRKVEQSKKTPLHLRQAQRQQQQQMQRRQNVNKRETDPSMRHRKHYFRRGQKGSAPASLHEYSLPEGKWRKQAITLKTPQ
jgi:hypothetical protein